jgi:hypothetical protein
MSREIATVLYCASYYPFDQSPETEANRRRRSISTFMTAKFPFFGEIRETLNKLTQPLSAKISIYNR